MNLRDDEEDSPVAGSQEPRKRKIVEVDEPIQLTSLAADKFGALRNSEASERPSVLRCMQTTGDSSTGSFTPTDHQQVHNIPGGSEGGGGGGGGRQLQQGETESKENKWSRYIGLNLETEGTSSGGHVRVTPDYPSSHTSTPISCTLHEITSTSAGAGPPTLQPHIFLPAAAAAPHPSPELHNRNVYVSTPGVEPEPEPQNVLLQLGVAAGVHDEQSEQGLNAAEISLPPALSRIYSAQAAPAPAPAAAPAPTTSMDRRRFNVEGGGAAATVPVERAGSSEPPSLDDLPRFAPVGDYTENSDDARLSRQSTDQYPVRIKYRFASANLEASLLERMEQQQRVQDEEDRGHNRICGHVISPEDLIWGSVKHYCAMVLDRETTSVLGTAVLFISADNANIGSPAAGGGSERQAAVPTTSTSPRPGAAKSAWVTSVKVVEGRTEVLIKNSRGSVHVAQLMLTSTTLGLALFSVDVGPGTFALGFLSRMISLPHRLFVDVDRSDRVYLIGYEEPWESEAGIISDVRVRPGRVIDAGRQAVVEVDFTTGQLGGSIDSPAGFRGGLVVRADGLLAGVVTGEVLSNHPTNIDFSPAFNIYALLEEL